MTHLKHVHVIITPNMGYSNYMATVRSSGVLKPGVGKVNVCLQNHSKKQITLPKQSKLLLEKLKPEIPWLDLLALKPTENKFVGVGDTTKKKQMERQRELLNKIDLTGLWDWILEDQ